MCDLNAKEMKGDVLHRLIPDLETGSNILKRKQ